MEQAGPAGWDVMGRKLEECFEDYGEGLEVPGRQSFDRKIIKDPSVGK